MNDTNTSTDEVRGKSFRTIVDMKRSRDDRLIGGVCAGAARHLNIDPVVVRVVVAVLTLVGFAGVILYLAGWLLLPAEDADRSVVAEWFGLDKNEEQVRHIGLVVAGILAVLAVLGDNAWAEWTGWVAAFTLLPAAAVYYLFVVRRRKIRDEDEAVAASVASAQAYAANETERAMHFAQDTADSVTAEVDAKVQAKLARVNAKVDAKVAKAYERKSRALLGLTVSTMIVVLASMRIWSDFNDPINWLTYVAVALGIVGVGLLVGTFYGYSVGLYFLGGLLAVILAIGSAFPTGRIGEQVIEPTTAIQVQSDYDHGIGHMVLDLTQVSDPGELLGRTIDLDMGVGHTQVFVPKGLNVSVVSHMSAGEVIIFDRREDGTQFDVDVPGLRGEPSVTIDINQNFGQIEVTRK